MVTRFVKTRLQILLDYKDLLRALWEDPGFPAISRIARVVSHYNKAKADPDCGRATFVSAGVALT